MEVIVRIVEMDSLETRRVEWDLQVGASAHQVKQYLRDLTLTVFFVSALFYVT